MPGGIEAAGDIATGGLVARAIERDTGIVHGDMAHGSCLNCGTALVGNYCHACGQTAHIHRTLGSIGHDLLHGVFHFEGKVWRTLPMLARHPGRLTRCYIDGHRARYVSPLALFLFAVFVMAATFSWLGGSHGREAAETPQSRAEAVRVIDQQIAGIQARQREIAVADTRDHATNSARRIETSALAFNVRALQAQRERALTGQVDEHAFDDAATGVSWIDHVIGRVRENPRLLMYKIQSSSYKFSWALIPISTPFVALLFLWRRFPMYDHAIFVTYSLSFMTFLGAVLRVMSVIGLPGFLTGLLFVCVPPVHIFAQLRGAYGIGRFSAFWRTILLLVFAGVALTVFAAAVATLEIYEA